LPGRDPTVVDAGRCRNAVLSPKRLHPHAPGIVNVSSHRPNRAPRCPGNRKVPERRQEAPDKFCRDPVIRSPGSEHGCP
jgi:hypothetical protein